MYYYIKKLTLKNYLITNSKLFHIQAKLKKIL
jgi:hypothetical protein